MQNQAGDSNVVAGKRTLNSLNLRCNVVQMSLMLPPSVDKVKMVLIELLSVCVLMPVLHCFCSTGHETFGRAHTFNHDLARY